MLAIFKKQRRMIARYRKVFGSTDGQIVLKDIVSMCGLTRSSFDQDPHKTAFFEGQRSIALRILKSVNISDGELDKLLKQAQEMEFDQEEQYE